MRQYLTQLGIGLKGNEAPTEGLVILLETAVLVEDPESAEIAHLAAGSHAHTCPARLQLAELLLKP